MTPFRQGHKTDSNDALAVAEAARRPNIKEAPVKTVEQQGLQAMLRARDRLIQECIAQSNHLRGILHRLAGDGVEGPSHVLRLVATGRDQDITAWHGFGKCGAGVVGLEVHCGLLRGGRSCHEFRVTNHCSRVRKGFVETMPIRADNSPGGRARWCPHRFRGNERKRRAGGGRRAPAPWPPLTPKSPRTGKPGDDKMNTRLRRLTLALTVLLAAALVVPGSVL